MQVTLAYIDGPASYNARVKPELPSGHLYVNVVVVAVLVVVVGKQVPPQHFCSPWSSCVPFQMAKGLVPITSGPFGDEQSIATLDLVLKAWPKAKSPMLSSEGNEPMIVISPGKPLKASEPIVANDGSPLKAMAELGLPALLSAPTSSPLKAHLNAHSAMLARAGNGPATMILP